jgi:3-hydroxyisobutyrate dehydrogenase-like beta-hydroxyacid dehydrogenase
MVTRNDSSIIFLLMSYPPLGDRAVLSFDLAVFGFRAGRAEQKTVSHRSRKMELGVIGAGAMGSAIVKTLASCGHVVHIYNRTREKAQALATDHIRVVETAAEAAATGLVLSIVSSDEAIEHLVFGRHGIMEGLPSNGIHISSSTISVRLSSEMHAAHQERGQNFLAAPVLGRPPAAEKGELFVVVGGDAQQVARAQPVFDSIGQNTFFVSSTPSHANLVKICSNFMIYSTIEQFGEIFALAERSGLPKEAVFEVLTQSFFGGLAHKHYGRDILEQTYDPPAADVFLGLKDNGLLLDAAEAQSVRVPFGLIIKHRFLECIATGKGRLDLCSMAEQARIDSGLPGYQPTRRV